VDKENNDWKESRLQSVDKDQDKDKHNCISSDQCSIGPLSSRSPEEAPVRACSRNWPETTICASSQSGKKDTYVDDDKSDFIEKFGAEVLWHQGREAR